MGSNLCSQIVAQSTQVTEESGGASWQPALPITIVGSGFGALTFGSSLQAAIPAVITSSTSPNYLTIYDCGSGTLGSGCSGWTSPATHCEIYVANWTDSTISLVVNLPVNKQNYYQNVFLGSGSLSPLADFSLNTFSESPNCSVSTGDNLYFAVTNPQTLATITSGAVPVQAAGYTALY